MAHFTSEFTTMLVEYIQQDAYMLIEFIQSSITQNYHFSIRGMGS